MVRWQSASKSRLAGAWPPDGTESHCVGEHAAAPRLAIAEAFILLMQHLKQPGPGCRAGVPFSAGLGCTHGDWDAVGCTLTLCIRIQSRPLICEEVGRNIHCGCEEYSRGSASSVVRLVGNLTVAMVALVHLREIVLRVRNRMQAAAVAVACNGHSQNS